MHDRDLIRRMNEAGRGVAPAMASFAHVAKGVSRAIRELGLTYYRLACDCYLKAHETLPGSERTKRLRKKRRTMVMEWFREQLEDPNHAS